MTIKNVSSTISTHYPQNALESERLNKNLASNTNSYFKSADSFTSINEHDIYNNYSEIKAKPNTINDSDSTTNELIEKLKSNEEYMRQYNASSRWSDLHLIDKYPDLENLMRNLVLNDSETYELVQKLVCAQVKHDKDTAMYTDMYLVTHRKEYAIKNYKSDYKEYDLEAMLDSGSDTQRGHVILAYSTILSHKGSKVGLTEAERICNSFAAEKEDFFGPDATLTNKLKPIADYVNGVLEQAQKPITSNDSFTITFNNNFSFNVSGGEKGQAKIFGDALNAGGEKMLHKIVSSLFYHRREVGQINPWNTEEPFYEQAKLFGVADARNEVSSGMQKLFDFYKRHNANEILKKHFGVDYTDFELIDGELKGKTEQAKQALNNPLFKDTYNDRNVMLLLNSPNEIDFSFLQFKFENGEFTMEY